MKQNLRKVLGALLILAVILSLAGCGEKKEEAPEAIKIGIPDDVTNGGRALKLLESAGLITVDPNAGWVPELKDITGYLYHIEIIPAAANTLPATLEDYGGATINGTYAIPSGLIPSKDGLIVENQADATNPGEKNPFINVIVARTDDADNPLYKPIVKAYNSDLVAHYSVVKYNEASVPSWEWKPTEYSDEELLKTVDYYESSPEGKTVVKVGVCGANNDTWKAVQKILDDENAGIYVELVTFDAYTLPNEALNSGEIDLNSFQHYAYLNKEIESEGYTLKVIGDTSMAPLTLYSKKFNTLDELKEAAGKK